MMGIKMRSKSDENKEGERGKITMMRMNKIRKKARMTKRRN